MHVWPPSSALRGGRVRTSARRLAGTGNGLAACFALAVKTYLCAVPVPLQPTFAEDE